MPQSIREVKLELNQTPANIQEGIVPQESSIGDVVSPKGFGEMDLKVIQGTVSPFKESSIADNEFNTSFQEAGHD
jgi:hypothetical protein